MTPNLPATIDKLMNASSLQEQIALVQVLNEHMFDSKALTELALYLRQYCRRVAGIPAQAVDVVGTGGDGYNTLNFSTLAALVAAGAGVAIAKHGNKAATSSCGSFDLLGLLGVPIPQTPEQAAAIFAQSNRVFLFAPYFHPIMARVAEVRQHFKAKGQKTIFNIIGPLINPSFNQRIVTGVYEPKLIKPYAQTLVDLGFTHGYVFYGNGLDELTLTGHTHYARLEHGSISYGNIAPDELALAQCPVDELIGGDPQTNLQQAKMLLAGKLAGPKTDMVLANVAAVIRVASGFTISWSAAVTKARASLPLTEQG